MNILFLGNSSNNLIPWLSEHEDLVYICKDPINLDYVIERKIDFIISYGYRHIIKPDVIDYMSSRCINLHISYLPQNRGADPNLWSAIEGTQPGVTIHQIDRGLDSGDILVQCQVDFTSKDTLKTSYETLHRRIVDLFKTNWKLLRDGEIVPKKQVGRVTYHKTSDKEQVKHLLINGWNTPLSAIKRERQEILFGL